MSARMTGIDSAAIHRLRDRLNAGSSRQKQKAMTATEAVLAHAAKFSPDRTISTRSICELTGFKPQTIRKAAAELRATGQLVHRPYRSGRPRIDPELLKDKRVRPKRGGPIPPCARCGTSGGPAITGASRPTRYDGSCFRLTGPICTDCRTVLIAAARIVADLGSIVPCAACADGSPENPRRVPGESFGVDGPICLGCRDDFSEEREQQRRGDQATRARAMVIRRTRIVRAIKIRDDRSLPLREAWRMSRAIEAMRA